MTRSSSSIITILVKSIGTICGILAIILIIGGILIKTLFYNILIDGIDKMRYIDNTIDMEGECSNLLIGDLTCYGLTYKAWLMSSNDLRDICLQDTEPNNKALKAWSGWCDDDDDEDDGGSRCIKEDMCRYGIPYTYYPYNITNPKDILIGYKPIVEELEPIELAKSVEKVSDSINIDLWNNEGIAEWDEINTFKPANNDDNDYINNRMSEKVYVPNIALFGTMSVSGQDFIPMDTMETIGLFNIIQSTVKMISDAIDNNTPTSIQTIILSHFITSQNASKMQYFHSSLSLLLGPLAGLNGELSLKGLGPYFTANLQNGNMIAASVPPTIMGSELSAYMFKCVSLHDINTESCIYDNTNNDDIIKKDNIDNTFSDTSKERIWRYIYDTNFTDQTASMIGLLMLQSQLTNSEFTSFFNHINYARTYALSNYQPLRHLLWDVTNPNSIEYDADYEYYPRFIRMTVGQLLGYEGEYFFDKVTQTPISLSTAGTTRISSTRQYISSKYGDKGLFYYTQYNNKEYACTYDKDCMQQTSFINNMTCDIDINGCNPTLAHGYSIRYIPGTLNKKADNEANYYYHKEGAQVTIFVPDIFNRVLFDNNETDMDWDGLKVDRWTLSDVTFRVENCNGENPLYSAGIDCKSPYVTADVGYYFSPNPTLIKLPLYASLPHFADTGKMSSIKDNYYPGDGRIEVIECSVHETCKGGGNRNFISEIWTEPITGMLMYGTQKLQFNSYFTPISNVSNGDITEEVLLPLVWVDKNMKAWPFQVDEAKVIQKGVALFSILGIILIIIGVIIGIGAGLLLRMGIKKNKENAVGRVGPI